MSGMDVSRYPRTLVVAGNPFTREGNNGLTLSSLFKGWPRDRLAQVYLPTLTPLRPTFDVCETFWALTPLGLRRELPPTARASGLSRPSSGSRVRHALLRTIRPLRPRLEKLYAPLREWSYSYPGILRGRELAAIDAFAPELIFSNLGTLSVIRVALAFARRYGVGIVPHFTDDWIMTDCMDPIGQATIRPALLRGFDEILTRAPVAMTISPYMADEYESRYGRPFEAFTQCVDSARFPNSRSQSHGTRIEMVYAGQLSIGRWRNLRRIGESLLRLREEGVDARLSIYTLPHAVAEFRSVLTLDPVLRVVGHATAHELPLIYADADVLVHVESFEPNWARYTRLSLSTKLTEYMMAGRAIFGFGPATSGSMRFIVDTGAGSVASEDSETCLDSELRRLLRSRESLARVGSYAREIALAQHEGRIVRERFRQAMRDAADGRGAHRSSLPISDAK